MTAHQHHHIVRNWLNEVFPNRWIGRFGPIAWPPRSPDLTPLDFFLWGLMKDYVYAVEIHTLEQLQQRIEESAGKAREAMAGFNMANAVQHRLQLCVVENGGHIENFI